MQTKHFKIMLKSMEKWLKHVIHCYPGSIPDVSGPTCYLCCVLVTCSTWHGLCTSCKSFASSGRATSISCLIDFGNGWASGYDSKWLTPKMDDGQSILTTKSCGLKMVRMNKLNKPSTQGQHLKRTKNRCYIQRIWWPQGNQDHRFRAPECPPSAKQTWKVGECPLQHPYYLRTVQQIYQKSEMEWNVWWLWRLECTTSSHAQDTSYLSCHPIHRIMFVYPEHLLDNIPVCNRLISCLSYIICTMSDSYHRYHTLSYIHDKNWPAAWTLCSKGSKVGKRSGDQVALGDLMVQYFLTSKISQQLVTKKHQKAPMAHGILRYSLSNQTLFPLCGFPWDFGIVPSWINSKSRKNG